MICIHRNVFAFSLVIYYLCVAGALKAFACFTPYAGAGHLLRHIHLGIAFAAEMFLACFHNLPTGSYRHGTIENTGIALFTRIGALPEGIFDMAFLAAPHKTDGVRLPHLRTVTYTAAAEDTICVMKGITDLLDATPHGYILNGTGVGRVSHQKFGDIFSQFLHPFRVGPDNHAFLNPQGAGSGNLRLSVTDVLHDAQTAGADIGEKGYMAEVGYANTVFYRCIKNADPFHGLYQNIVNC
jgi:hypothetical protein